MKILDEVRARHGFRLIGYVVLPEQVRLLMTEPRSGDPSKILQVLKQKVSADLRQGRSEFPTGQLALKLARGQTEKEHYWQRRFYDFNVWSAKKVQEKLEYMHANPVKRKLVLQPKDWPWSSFSFYAKGEAGLIRIDTVEESRSEK